MHVYVFEPHAGRCKDLIGELRAANVTPILVTAGFFSTGMAEIGEEGLQTRGILVRDDPAACDRIRALRGAGCRNPLLILIETQHPDRTALLLDHGADDVVAPPVVGHVLRSRINAISRRVMGQVGDYVTVGEVTAYFDGRDPEVSGKRLKLPRREHEVFQMLAMNANKVVPKEVLHASLYGGESVQPDDKVIDVFICKLRKKIAAAAGSGHPYIETVYRRGYKLCPAEGDFATGDPIATRVAAKLDHDTPTGWTSWARG